MANQPVALILGSGPNVGQHVARALVSKGYKVALASRSAPKDSSTSNPTTFQTDLSNPSSVPELFTRVKETLGTPNVVVYNAYTATRNDPKHTFSLPLADFEKDLNVNTTSAYAAAQQAVLGFEQLPDSVSKTFIFTGNAMNEGVVLGPVMSLGAGKSATAHVIQAAATAYAEKGYKFYYADQREEDGTPMYTGLSGQAHAEHYVELIEGKEQGSWQQTFVAGKGYRKF